MPTWRLGADHTAAADREDGMRRRPLDDRPADLQAGESQVDRPVGRSPGGLHLFGFDHPDTGPGGRRPPAAEERVGPGAARKWHTRRNICVREGVRGM